MGSFLANMLWKVRKIIPCLALVPKEESESFSIERKYRVGLNSGFVSKELRVELENIGIQLSQDEDVSAVIEEPNRQWIIADANRTYCAIINGGSGLDVYPFKGVQQVGGQDKRKFFIRLFRLGTGGGLVLAMFWRKTLWEIAKTAFFDASSEVVRDGVSKQLELGENSKQSLPDRKFFIDRLPNFSFEEVDVCRDSYYGYDPEMYFDLVLQPAMKYWKQLNLPFTNLMGGMNMLGTLATLEQGGNVRKNAFDTLPETLHG